MKPHTCKQGMTIAAVAMLAMAGCGSDVSDPEAEIRAWVDAMQSAAEDKARRDILDRISPSYTDARGHSRDDVNDLLRIYFLRQNSIVLLSTINDIEIIGETAAEVSITVGMAGTSDRALGISADAYDFELELEHDGDQWLLLSARWGQLGDSLL